MIKYQYWHMKQFPCNITKMLNSFLFLSVPFGSYFEYYNRWQEELQSNPNINVLIVHFEDLKRVHIPLKMFLFRLYFCIYNVQRCRYI